MLRVLQSTPAPGPRTNPYVHQLHTALRQAGVEVVPFAWRVALTGRYDLFHVHWAEILVKGHDPVRTAARRVLTALLVLRLSVTRTPVVRTLHNVRPHEPVRGLPGLLLAALGRRESWWIRLNGTTPVPDADRTTTIPHGHYRDWFAGAQSTSPVPGRLVLPGLVRAYKGYDEIVDALQLLGSEVSLHLVGAVQDKQLEDRLREAASRDPRLIVTLRHVDDAELAIAVQEAQLVVLPYRDLQNSGAALLALSVGRPVLLPRSPAAQALADEVGRDWVSLAGAGDPQSLASAISEALSRTLVGPGGEPDLSARGWDRGAQLHLAAYTAAFAAKGPA